MDKTKLTKFIDKYHLGGNVESIKIEIKDNSLKTGFSTEDRTLIGKVVVKDFKFEDSEFGIFATSELSKILGALESEISMGINKVDDKPVNLKIEDSILKTIFVLADPEIISTKAGSIKQLPEFDAELKIDSTFITTYLKSFSAIQANNVAIKADNTDVTFIIGFSDINTNRISFKSPGTIKKTFSPISFSSEYFKQILVANKDCSAGKLSISQQGLLKFQFKEGDFSSEYFLVKLV
ncbi:hypothetical protein M0P65_07635 [Candidatus Gracilibacteria bacterium]|jgi:hypothetical protein|nr:hypothetical protein [Candidatus Gracilibacteria bacterium]